MSSHRDDSSRAKPRSWKALSVFAVQTALGCAVVLWVCWPSLLRMKDIWTNLPQYSHGYLVPLFAAYLGWHRRDFLLTEEPLPSWWGIPLIAAGLALKWVGVAYFMDFLDDISLVILLFGVVVTTGGGNGLNWSWPGIAFLLFMIPFPYRVETAVQLNLLRFATAASTYSLQTLGYAAFAEGNTIHLPASNLGVLDACSGLRMGIVCSAMAALATLVSTAPMLQRLTILISGIPLALVTNILRITVMGIVSEQFGQPTAEWLFHDASGYVMMPMAVVLLLLEIRLLTWIFDVPEDDPHRRPLFLQSPVQM